MRTLVEAEGSIETSLTRPGSRRKATLMVRELKKYRINATGISETKLFGQNLYEIDGYTILHSSRPVPSEGEAARAKRGSWHCAGPYYDGSMEERWWHMETSQFETDISSGEIKWSEWRKKTNTSL